MFLSANLVRLVNHHVLYFHARFFNTANYYSGGVEFGESSTMAKRKVRVRKNDGNCSTYRLCVQWLQRRGVITDKLTDRGELIALACFGLFVLYTLVIALGR